MDPKKPKAKDSVFKISTYTVDTCYDNIIGKGAFVYKATDADNKTIAAKTVDGKRHSRILTQDLRKLAALNHENIVKLHESHQKGNNFWMFMEYCCHGDLNDFFVKRKLVLKDKLKIMQGIARGINYLHSQNVIHRDIKPANILIAQDSPVIPKLTDFDLSKSLDQDYETSVMSSNVGTNAFKAPKFFNRIGGKLRYHRNVDIYAAGLTFLALIQGREKHRKLIPQIETPREDSELHVQSIGQLIAERIKYNVPELNIVHADMKKVKPGALSDEGLKIKVRRLIQKMTLVDPKERLTASEVQQFFHDLNPDDSSLSFTAKRRKMTETITIFVKTLSGKTFPINIEPSGTVAVVKEIIEEIERIPKDQQKFFFCGNAWSK